VNTFEVAVLRVLIKRQQPLKLSTLVSGFPDDSEDNVLSAVSNLRLHGYLVLDDYQPNGYVSINNARRKEILQIVDSDIHSNKFESPHLKEKEEDGISIPEKKSTRQVTARHQIAPGIRAVAFSALLIVGLVSAIGISLPSATSPDSEFVAYHESSIYKKWSGLHRADAHEGDKTQGAPYPSPPLSASFVALKDCIQKPLQEQQT
jgi:hypothetical protein